MKKLTILTAGLWAIMMCACSQPQALPLLDEADFQATVDGKQTSLYTLKAGNLVMQVTNFGGRVVTLWTPDREGRMEDIVLGYNNIDKYINNPGERFLGACVGVVANRIGEGRFTLNGKRYTTPQNNNGQTLHGGLKGVDMVVWDVVEVSDNAITLHYLAADGEEGFPGNRDITMTYTLTEQDEFQVDYTITTDAPALVNISHHSFFNLKGEGNGTILDHVLTIAADHVTPTNEWLIPTGEVLNVEGTPYDFREPHAIGERIDTPNEQLTFGKGYDANWCLSREDNGKVESVATLYCPENGRHMEVLTDQVGLQFYSGNFFDGTTTGKYGRTLDFRESVALETQKWPDAINHSNFPSIVLNPQEEYTHTCIYRFSTK